MKNKLTKEQLKQAYSVGNFFVSDIYAYYLDTYKGELGKVQVEVLSYIHNHKEVTIKQLSKALNVSKQHASKIIAKLSEMDLIDKRQDPEDARSSFFSLNKKGISYIEDHISLSNDYLINYVESLNNEEAKIFLESVKNISNVLGLR